MARTIDIDALANEALALVEQEQVKTASESSPESELRTDVGRALKEAADLIRGHKSEITNADLHIAKTGGVAPAPTKQASSNLPASALGARFRKMATDVRASSADLEESKAVKVAQLITAAVGLQHLQGKTAATKKLVGALSSQQNLRNVKANPNYDFVVPKSRKATAGRHSSQQDERIKKLNPQIKEWR